MRPLEILKSLHESAQNLDKVRWLSIPRKAGFSKQFLIDKGWSVSNDSWARAGHHIESFGAGNPPVQIRGRPPIGQEPKDKIVEFVLDSEHSSPSPFRSITTGPLPPKVDQSPRSRARIPVQVRHLPISHIHQKFQESVQKISSTKFREILKEEYPQLKKPTKKTDYCPICAGGPNLQPHKLVYFKKSGTMYLDEGNHRLKYCKARGIQWIPCYVQVNNSDNIQFFRELDSNHNNKGPSGKRHPQKSLNPASVSDQEKGDHL
jgi:hypothetical protein